MENDKNNDNIVRPENIDFNNIKVQENDSMLGRERENIVKATIEANKNLDEKKAYKVNEEIRIKKMHPFIRIIIVLLSLIIAISLSYLTFKLIKNTMDNDNLKMTTTTTKASEYDRIMNYINKTDNIRKFQDDQTILVLSPKGYDLVNGNNYYLLINYDLNGLKSTSYGNYSIFDDELKLNTLDAGEISYKITKDGITFNGAILKIFDSEMKYYSKKSNNKTELLIINGTLKSEYAMYITSDGNITNVLTSSYLEDKEKISLNIGLEFKKDGNNLKSDKNILKLAS